MIIWPNRLGACDEAVITDNSTDHATCARIRFSDPAGNSGWLAIEPDHAGRQPVFHSGEISYSSQSRSLATLGEMRENLAIISGR